ncbi:restriction endonuclease [Mesorhizobium sp. AR10]|uniref:restriction endonuclease n=1 Tax=Mesorhizobium sp. AR10 TaxID=2865839 RepID=UPI00215FD031|nr:restriction endonuclease [Mesorhizobium sp. AR10]UVK40564.1 restriction endonuclease [Mesorhizobium sp. AR10]
MTPDWKQYQEEAAEFFRSLGLKASTDVRLAGVRTVHDIDVLVTIDVAGFEVKWLVECKHWKTAITKLHVLGLRTIVMELGADRGIILCEEGFQSGAVEAANLTNVQVTSLALLRVSSKDAIYAARLRELFDRTERCRERYWDIPKEVRIAKGLRFDVGDTGVGEDYLYSGARIVDFASEIIAKALRGQYPIRNDSILLRTTNPNLPERLDGPQEVVAMLEPLLTRLEGKLDAA